ncbi:hypothetical protein F183_A07610 [Bryobacterales bacterium F-183]|nr:hypothetical protein F183_A07610 [Bryobacterales bacterium F-183]
MFQAAAGMEDKAATRLTMERPGSDRTFKGPGCAAVTFHATLTSSAEPKLTVEIKNGTSKKVAAFQYKIGPVDGSGNLTNPNVRTAFAYVSRQALAPLSSFTDEVPFLYDGTTLPQFAARPTLVEFADGTGCYLPEAEATARSLAGRRLASDALVKSFLNGESLESIFEKLTAAKADQSLAHELRLFLMRTNARSELASIVRD